MPMTDKQLEEIEARCTLGAKIAHSPADIRALIAEVKRLRGY